jgi:hypothetical protein
LLLELVIVPCTPAIQAVEDTLSMALLALVLGMCPLVTPAMMLQHLCNHYDITEDLITVCRTWPNDFIIRFSRQ